MKTRGYRFAAQRKKACGSWVKLRHRQCCYHQRTVTHQIPVYCRCRPARRPWGGELIEARLYSLLDNRLGDLAALIIGKAVIQPIVANRSPEGRLGGDEKFVTFPIGKSANGQKLGLCAAAISRVARNKPHQPECLYPETEQTCDIKGRSGTIR